MRADVRKVLESFSPSDCGAVRLHNRNDQQRLAGGIKQSDGNLPLKVIIR